MDRPDILDLDLEALEAWSERRGHPRFRAAQIATWLYRHDVEDFAAMGNLPAALRAELAAAFRIGRVAVERVARSTDGTRPAACSGNA